MHDSKDSRNGRCKRGIMKGMRSSLSEAPWGSKQVCVGENKTAYLIELVSL